MEIWYINLRIIGNPNFSNLFKRILNHCLVFNPIMVEGYDALFSFIAVVQASDSMTASM